MASQRNTLNPIKPVYPTVKLEAGETPAGHTAAGNMVVQRTVTKIRKEPIIDPATGLQRYKPNAVGQPVVPLFRKIETQEVEEYEKIATRDGGIKRNYGFKPNPEEQARLERQQKIDRTQAELAEALVDNGLDVGALIGALKDETPKRGRKAAAD